MLRIGMLSRRGFSTLKFSSEVASALKNGDPIVALESTIITHGMPYPENLKTAMDVEQVVRRTGAVPATVALIEGEIHAGLSSQMLEDLASSKDDLVKVSRRDLAPAMAQKMTGGTTVAGTMVVAHKAGIQMFVTGGIGGVHRGAEITMDVSADLIELGRTPVTVVSAGVKSILDIEKTLEFLETQGVCVATYGDSKEFPCFWTRSSGHEAPWNVRDPSEAAAVIASRLSLNLQSGMLIANPIPTNHEADGKFIEACVQDALKESQIQNIRGKDITPFILNRVHHATSGASLRSNVALVKHNALVGSLIAKELSNILPDKLPQQQESADVHSFYIGSQTKSPLTINPSRPVVVGGCMVDFNIKLAEDKIEIDGKTYKGRVFQGYGGVGRNIADCTSRLGLSPLLISAVGSDLNGKGLLGHNPLMDKSGIEILRDATTATCCAVHNRAGQLLYNVGDMLIHDRITPELLLKYEKDIEAAPIVVLDANIPEDTLRLAVDMCTRLKKPLWYEPTIVNKSTKAFDKKRISGVWYTSPNRDELEVMYRDLTGGNDVQGDEVTRAAKMAKELLRSGAITRAVYATLGPKGLVRVTKTNDLFDAIHFEAPQAATIKTSNGAGDCQASTIITGLALQLPEEEYMGAAMDIPLLTLASYSAVPDTLSKDDLKVKNVVKTRRIII
ncbi:pseudouridine-metabolizing bifunctional protein C1861.05 [Galendromus occidentalis]|uniref:Pseudouridine-metabolizing bifunctional protein C1861.05 n=1 Tax=Galendromus occidentalis TaxID=34638 RepID=A0AAJ7P9U8_9ACAR|nr:pseudouridine-metabolizing bifunctional protein C1861.05 [Galendromus occidentalis]